MPNTSLVELGTTHPYPERGVTYPEDPRPTIAILPAAPHPAVPTLDAYLEAAPPNRTEKKICHVSHVAIKPTSFILNAAWRRTAIGPAMQAHTLHLPSVTPAMFEALNHHEREQFLDVLSRDDVVVSWRDGRGKRYRRGFNRWLRVRLGRKFKINGAGAFTLMMAQAPTQGPTRQVLTSGLPYVINPLRGRGATLFTLELTTQTLQRVLPRVVTPASPVEMRHWSAAAAALVERYLEQHTNETPIEIRNASLRLMRSLHAVLPRDAALTGAMAGVVVAGGMRYCAGLTSHDIAQRFRRTSAVNLVWAAQNAVPLYFVAGPVAVVAVAWAIAWERLHPPRAYGPTLQHLRGELETIFETGGTGFDAHERREALRWMHICQKMNGLT